MSESKFEVYKRLTGLPLNHNLPCFQINMSAPAKSTTPTATTPTTWDWARAPSVELRPLTDNEDEVANAKHAEKRRHKQVRAEEEVRARWEKEEVERQAREEVERKAEEECRVREEVEKARVAAEKKAVEEAVKRRAAEVAAKQRESSMEGSKKRTWDKPESRAMAEMDPP